MKDERESGTQTPKNGGKNIVSRVTNRRTNEREAGDDGEALEVTWG